MGFPMGAAHTRQGILPWTPYLENIFSILPRAFGPGQFNGRCPYPPGDSPLDPSL